MDKIVCVSNCMHQRDGECKLDFTAITRDMTSVQCFRVREAMENGAGGGDGETGEKGDKEPSDLAKIAANPLLLCWNR